MQRVAALILLLIFISISDVGADEIIKKGETLSLQRCIEISLIRQPNILAATSTVDASRSRVGQSQANYYPQINLSAGYSRISPLSGTASNSSTRTSSGNFDQYSSSASLSQNIYDFGRTATQVKIQNFNLDSSRSDLENVSELTIFNVKQAYYGALAANRNVAVAAESVKQFQLHLEQAKGFFEAGTKPRFDVTKAQVDLGNAKLNLITAENSLKISRVVLNNAMGVPDAPEYEIEDNLNFLKYEVTFDKALETAYANRPDLKSLILKRQATESSIELAVKNYYPSLSGNASYNWSGEKFPLDHGWTAGATLSFPLFSGFLTKYQVEEAKANLNVIRANEETLRQGVLLDVQQSYLNLQQAEEKIYTAGLNVKQAEENLDIANGRYAAGVGNPIEVTDAEVSLINAKTAYNQALYDYKIAEASLQKALGVR
ncbi:MAG: TolC family protein [Nitrospirae bacterium]|nr:TolC family protein [Nitrospirota bacterium]